MIRDISKEWPVDDDAAVALQIIAASAGHVRGMTVEAPVEGVLVLTLRFVTILVSIVSLLLIPFTAGLSLIAFLFAKSSFPLTLRAIPTDDGTRLVLRGKTDSAVIEMLEKAVEPRYAT